jgi:hypothetical protein
MTDVKSQASVSTISAPTAARCTAAQPSLAAALVPYASPVATTCPLDALSRNRNLPALSEYTSNVPGVNLDAHTVLTAAIPRDALTYVEVTFAAKPV